MENMEEAKLPWIIVRLNTNYFCINCKYVRTIQSLPKKITCLPRSSEYIRGMFNLWGNVLPIIDLRKMMGMPTLEENYEDFKKEIDKRKDEHSKWVDAVCKAVRDNTDILVERNPHKCNFGKWYDNFSTDNEAVNYHLKKIREPHNQLHQVIDAIEKCQDEHQNSDDDEKNICKNKHIKNLRENYQAELLKLLDDTKDIMQLTYKEMIVVIEKDTSSMALVVDEIISVNDVKNIKSEIDNPDFNCKNYLSGVAKSENLEDEIFKIDIEKLIDQINESMSLAQY